MNELISKEDVLESLESKLDDIERYKQAFVSVYTFKLSEDEKAVAEKVLDWADTYIDNLINWERKLDKGGDSYQIYQEYARFPDNPILDDREREIYARLNINILWRMVL